jgi:hypothetical protein
MMYAQASKDNPEGGDSGSGAGAGKTGSGKKDDDVVDADFEEVK